MKITDAETKLRALAVEVAGLPLEMATAVHAAGAGMTREDILKSHAGSQDQPLRAANEWAQRRKIADGKDVTDIPGLDATLKGLDDAIAAFRAALPKVK